MWGVLSEETLLFFMDEDIMIFKPLFWPTLLTIPLVMLLMSLGGWQLSRLAEKTELISKFEKRSKSQPISVNQISGPIADFEFRRIGVTGKYLHQSEIYLTGRTYEGNAGFHVITPFETNNKKILVNRGWVSEDYKKPNSRPFSLIEGENYIEGILRLPGRKGFFVPENEPEQGFWFTLKPDEIARYLKQDEIKQDFYIDIIRTGEVITLPIAAEININVRNSHFNYALTWFGLALTLLVIYCIFHYQNGRLNFSSKSSSD